MYIAFRWLVGLSLAMWAAVCFIEFTAKHLQQIESSLQTKPKGIWHENATAEHKQSQLNKFSREHNSSIVHYATFVAGALAVTIYNKKKQIFLYVQSKFAKINFRRIRVLTIECLQCLKVTATVTGVACFEYCRLIWWNTVKLSRATKEIIVYCKLMNRRDNYQKVHITLIQRLQEVTEEKKSLGKMLIAALCENKKIKMQYHLETLSKHRLLERIKESEKSTKETRSQYVNFHQLYLVTNQENMFLKALVRKLTAEKEDAEKNLMTLVGEVYSSKNKELKSYCSRFIVSTKGCLLNSDVHSEIHKFLQHSKEQNRDIIVNCVTSNSHYDLTNLTRYSSTCVTKIDSNDCSIVSFVSDEPKLIGLPGEYVWTLKDKNGVVEKLYECDVQSDLCNGDAIRRIRQYSVYHDKDCFLDCRNSRTILNDEETASRIRVQDYSPDIRLRRQRFLTDSDAFKNFMQSNNVVALRGGASPATVQCV